MNEADALLREIRIDWETLITEDFNPLKQALKNRNSSVEASNFRNLFHKVEKVMEEIIERNYKGFSDSVLSYMESYHLNRKCHDNIQEIFRATKELSEMKIEVKDMVKEYGDVRVFKAKEEICLALLEVRKNFSEFCAIRDGIENDMKRGVEDRQMSSKLLEASKKIRAVYDLIDENGLGGMECIKRFRSEVDSEAEDIMRLVFRRINRFAFYNECEYQDDFRCVVVLNVLQNLEKYQIDSLEKEYFKVVESTIEEVEKSKEENQAEVLAKMVMGRTKTIIRNFRMLFEMADASFDGLCKKSKNFFEEEELPLRIYSPKCQETVEAAVNKIIRKFIMKYIEDPEKQCYEEMFWAENFVDDIDYGSVFESKYLIHEKMTRPTQLQASFSGSFTRILSSGIDLVIYMERYAINSEMKQYLRKILDERYVKEKESRIEKQIICLFNGEEWHRNDYLSYRLSFYSRYVDLVESFSSHPEFCNISIISEFLDNFLEKKFDVHFRGMFKSDIIKDCLSSGHTDEEAAASFKNSLLVRDMDRNSLFFQKQYYENMFFSLETLRDINKPIRGKRLESLYSSALIRSKFQVVLEILYFFDLFYREGNYANKNDYYLHKILGVVEDVYGSASYLGIECEYFGFMFECLNFYIQNNVARLNVRSTEELKCFLEKVKLLDEILGFINEEDSLKEAVRFIEDAISGDFRGRNGKVLSNKLVGK
ncbi:Sec8 exocyst complex component specific domain-containing protein [Encephalitozoon hellem]|nr:Sec8 exocyst complex component specific domain-containing protein [Encephalitozoon hellem]